MTDVLFLREQVFHEFFELGQLDGFFQYDVRLGFGGQGAGMFTPAGDGNDGDARVLLLDDGYDAHAADVRHYQIGNHQIDPIVIFFKMLSGFINSIKASI